jgi:putative transposase
MEQSRQNERQGTSGSILSQACPLQKSSRESKSATSESALRSKKTTLEDKNSLCGKSSQKPKSSKTSVVGSTSKEKDLTPYWNESTKEELSQLQSRIGTDYAGLGLTCSRDSASFAGQNSWFSTAQFIAPNKNLSQTYAPSSMFSPAEFTDSEDTLMGLKKIRVYPKTKEQKKILADLCGASRYYYNKTIEYLSKEGTVANRFSIQKGLLEDVPEWAKDVPYKVKQMAIDDACTAVKNAKKKFAKTGQFNKCGFRRKKSKRDSVYVPSGSVNALGIFPRLLKGLKVTEEIGDVDFDCRFMHDDGRFWICVPRLKRIKVCPDNQRKPVISLDPGVRAFLTGFTVDGFCEIGNSDFSRVFRLLYRLDECLSKKAKGSKERYNRAISSLKFKVKNLTSELHSKTANMLVRCFDNIVIPDFSPDKKMMEKLRSKTCRAMLTFAHAKFRDLLMYKAKEYSCKVWIQNEAHTSKTCSFCGVQQKIGGRKVMKCACGKELGRDFNGARGIFLRAMIDHPELKNSVLVNFG